MNGGPNSTPLQRRFAVALVPRDQQNDPVPRGDRTLQPAVDRLPGSIEAVAVKVNRSVWLNASRAQAPVPAAVQGRAMQGPG